MKRYLGIFILTIMVGLSGCASDTDSDTQVSSRAYSMQIQQNQNRVQTFNGRRQIRSSDGSMWTPPAGSDEDDLWSFAAITDEPPPEVAAAGHDRCIVQLRPENVQAWLTPQGRSLEELDALLDDKAPAYYAHKLAA